MPCSKVDFRTRRCETANTFCDFLRTRGVGKPQPQVRSRCLGGEVPPAGLATREGIFAGFSAGANVAAALKLLRHELAGATVAVVIPDSGLKYLSTDLWE